MPLESGQLLSHYRLVEKVGEGGMGVVWKAEDEVLNRSVAIKVLPADASRDDTRRKMFLEEAQLASSVSHAHIVQVHDFGSEGDLDFIVMEYVEGQPLNKIIHGRPLPPHKVAEYGYQVALAIARAHHRGLLHRDLKPGNILITSDGEVKVVDFGLAALFERRDTTLDSRLAGFLDSVTLELPADTPKKVAGTLPYMSPEQVRGEELDSRSDIFSLGAVLYELTTGQRPFGGTTPSEIAAAIQNARPRPVHEVISQVPFELDRAIQKALSARPSERYQTMDDFAVDLKRLARDLESGSSPSYEDLATPPARKTRWATVAVGGALAIALITTAVLLRPGDKRERTLPPIHRQLTFTGQSEGAEISPDGQFVAYVQRQDVEGGAQLFVQDVAGGEPLEILHAASVRRLRWSPTGTRLLVAAIKHGERSEEANQAPSLLLVPRLGGSVRQQQWHGPNFSWAPDGKRYVACWQNSKTLHIVDADMGEHSEIPLSGGFTFIADVEWSPAGDYLAIRTVGEAGQHSIWTIPSSGGTMTKIVEETERIGANRWSGNGASIYYLWEGRGTQDLRRIDINPDTGEAASATSTILTGIEIGDISFSTDGRKLAYSRSVIDSDLWLATLGDADQKAILETKQLTSGTSSDSNPEVAPDGGQVAFVRSGDLYTMSIEGGPTRQLTFTDASEWSPAWSPDDAWIAFASDYGGAPRVWKVAARGGAPIPFEKTRMSDHLVWAPGDRIVYQRPGNRNFNILDPETELETPLVKNESVGWIFSPAYSPDGTQLAVYWNRPNSDGTGGQALWTVSLAGSVEQRVAQGYFRPVGWSADGAWIYARNRGGSKVVRVRAEGGEVESVFEWPFEGKSGLCTPCPDKTKWVCAVGETKTDVWLAENFDPDAG